MLQLEISVELRLMTPKGAAKFDEKQTRGLKIDIKNLINFHASSRKSKNLQFDGLILFKAYRFLD